MQTANRDGTFHADHLLGCVAFSEGNFSEARRLQSKVLVQLQELGHLVGMASCLYDLALIDQAEGDIAVARRRMEKALSCYERDGGYPERARVVRTGLDKLDEGEARP